MAAPRDSDRRIAVRAGVSQPTITRARQRFLREGLISFEIVPDLAKLGFEILAFTTFQLGEPVVTEADNRVVFAAASHEGIFVMSVHKDHADYANFVSSYTVKSRLLAVTSKKPLKPLSFKNIPF